MHGDERGSQSAAMRARRTWIAAAALAAMSASCELLVRDDGYSLRALDSGIGVDDAAALTDADALLDGGATDATLDVATAAFEAPEVVAEQQTGLLDIAADGVRLFWVDTALQGIRSYGLQKDGGVGLGDFIYDRNQVSRVFVDATTVYWVQVEGSCYSTSSLLKVNKTGGSFIDMSTECHLTFTDVAQDPLNVVFTGKGDNGGVAVSVNKATGSATVVATGLPDIGSVATTPTFIYWGRANGSIERAPRPNGEGALFVASQTTQSLVADDTHLYWTNGGGSVVRLAHVSSGGVPEVLATNESAPSRIAVDDTNVYWIASGTGNIRSCPKSGGNGVTLSGAAGPAVALAVDARGVHWTVPAEGRVYSARKKPN